MNPRLEAAMMRPDVVRDGGGSAWKDYTARQVLGSQAASLVGMFGTSSGEGPKKKPKDVEEAEAQEARARTFGVLVWGAEHLPAPDFAVVPDEIGPSYRAELSVFLAKEGGLKEVRLWGPRRPSLPEARKDGSDLRRTAFRTAQQDPTLTEVRRRCRELEETLWPPEALASEDAQEASEQRLPCFKAIQPGKSESHLSAAEWFQANNVKEAVTQEFEPVAPRSWALCKPTVPVPKLPGIWYMHERQNKEGKHFPVAFFNSSTGKYYRNRSIEAIYNHDNSRWVQTGVPNQAQDQPMRLSHGSACFPGGSGRKDAMAVILPELHRTSAVMKLPLPFLDRPASLMILVDGLRHSSLAAEWCAKRFHTYFLPRLAACHSDPEDCELEVMVQEALEHLDHALLDSGARYAGCTFAVSLVLGTRLLLCRVGPCRAVLCTPEEPSSQPQAPGSKRPADSKAAKQDAAKWHARPLTGNVAGHSHVEVQVAERKRRFAHYAPLDFDGQRGEQLTAASSTEEALAGLSASEQALKKALRASNPFAALGMTAAQAIAAAPGAGQKAAEAFQAAVAALSSDPRAAAALNRVRAAAEAVDKMLSQDQFGTQQLIALFYAMDEEDGIMPPQKAASLLGVEPGCGEEAARKAVEFRYRAIFSGLESACPADAARGWNILGEVIDAAARPTATIWTPPAGARSVEASCALGVRDLKRPRKLVGLEFVCDLIHLEPGSRSCIVVLTDGARSVSNEQIAAAVAKHKDRPKAACLDLLSSVESSSGDGKEAPSLGALAAFLTVAAPAVEVAKDVDPKKRKLGETEAAPGGPFGERPKRVRIAHILLKCESMTAPDAMARRPAPKGRTQVDAEKLLLKCLKTLDEIPQGAPDSAKKTAAKFATLCREHSDCKSATSGALSDLGWVTPGQMKELEDVAFDLPVGAVSDVFVTPRGVHVLHRIA